MLKISAIYLALFTNTKTLDEEKKKEWEDSQVEPEPEPSENDYVTYGELANAIKEGVNSYGI